MIKIVFNHISFINTTPMFYRWLWLFRCLNIILIKLHNFFFNRWWTFMNIPQFLSRIYKYKFFSILILNFIILSPLIIFFDGGFSYFNFLLLLFLIIPLLWISFMLLFILRLLIQLFHIIFPLIIQLLILNSKNPNSF